MKKQYLHSDYPSVTQVLTALRKISLENWFKYNTLQYINEKSGKGKIIGTQIHEAIQKNIEKEKIELETEYPQEVKNAIKSFFLFKKEHPEIKLKKAEIQITSGKYKYNGTLDCLADQGKELILLDWKTGEAKEKDYPPIYSEHIYQAAAYVKGYNEMFKTNIEKAYIAVLAKDKIAYNLNDGGKLTLNAEIIHRVFKEVFLPALKIYNFQKKEKEVLWSGK